MSENVREIIKNIRAKQTAFYNRQKDNPNHTPRVAVIRPTATSKSISGTVKLINVSREYILGLTTNGKQ